MGVEKVMSGARQHSKDEAKEHESGRLNINAMRLAAGYSVLRDLFPLVLTNNSTFAPSFEVINSTAPSSGDIATAEFAFVSRPSNDGEAKTMILSLDALLLDMLVSPNNNGGRLVDLGSGLELAMPCYGGDFKAVAMCCVKTVKTHSMILIGSKRDCSMYLYALKLQKLNVYSFALA